MDLWDRAEKNLKQGIKDRIFARMGVQTGFEPPPHSPPIHVSLTLYHQATETGTKPFKGEGCPYKSLLKHNFPSSLHLRKIML